MEQTEKTQEAAMLTPKFSVGAVCRVVPGLSRVTIQGWLNRRLLTRMEKSQLAPGPGAQRLFSVGNILQVATMTYLAGPLGVPLEKAAEVGEHVAAYAIARVKGRKPKGWASLSDRYGFVWHCWINASNEIQILPTWDDGLDERGKPDNRPRPPAYVTLHVEFLIESITDSLIELVQKRESLRRERRYPEGEKLLQDLLPLAEHLKEERDRERQARQSLAS